MKIKYQIHKDSNLLIQKFIGEWSNQDYEAFLKHIVNEPDYKYVSKKLSDLRETKLAHIVDDIKAGAEIVKENIKNAPEHVFLVDKPMATAIVHLYVKETTKNNPLKDKYCSSMSCAIDLLQLKLSKNEIEAKIENLENQF